MTGIKTNHLKCCVDKQVYSLFPPYFLRTRQAANIWSVPEQYFNRLLNVLHVIGTEKPLIYLKSTIFVYLCLLDSVDQLLDKF